MGDMEVGVATIDDKGFYGLREETPVKAVSSSNPSLQVSVSFGRFENDSLSWEKFSAFSPNKYLEEVGKCATPGSVAQKKAYFEAHYKKIAERKAEIMDQEKQMDKNGSFRSIVSDQESVEHENGESVAESEVDDGSNEQFTCDEDKHVTDIAVEVNELSVDEVVNEDTVIVKKCQSSVDHVKEDVKDCVESPVLEKAEEIAFVEERPEVVIHVQEEPDEVSQVEDVSETGVREEVREEIVISKDDGKDSNETPMKEVKKEKKPNLIKKSDANVRTNPTRSSPKPNQVTRKPEANKTVTSRKTPPSKEIRNMMKATKIPAAPISKAPQGFSTPRVYKPASQNTSLSTSYSSLKKETPSALLKKKQTAPKSLHISMNLDPPASDPTALTSTRKSLIMERMGDKDIVKRAFKTFQKSFDFKNSVDGENTALKQNNAKATSIPSVATRPKEKGRPTKASIMEKSSGTTAHRSPSHGLKSNETAEKQQKELSKSGARPVEKTRLQKNPKQAGVNDAKTRRDSLNPKAKPMQGSLPVRTLPKGSLDKVL
ncbi:PREDICTED: protein WVD2-like 7 isoform X1 [Camelina sativa]|uniref:Protein WVD2-like 7 isoform X1 n=1 Tax=Camelina sativa TaxID=90675 RepID=A0ABM1QWR4_CAMSA|nr:PREDICTED: protein WVD2-like 7 isoform X1 [Camelina sativa]XP_019091203.1 PREDICTED: protein WVD2-like 7 isoform X1 [Camelina sativa]